MSSVTEIIIWASPCIAGLCIWLIHEAYQSIQSDIKELKDRQIKTREDMADIKADIKMTSNKITDVNKSVDIAINSVKNLDSKTGDTKELSLFLRTMENRLTSHEANYGKVILILQKLAGQKKHQDP